MLENPRSMSALLDTAVRCARFAIDFSLGIRHGVATAECPSRTRLVRVRVYTV